MTAKLEIHMFPCLGDNYGYLVHNAEQNLTASIDSPDSNAILSQLRHKGWSLTHIFNTHHHYDHAGGNLALKQATGCTIVGATIDAERIPGIDVRVSDGETFDFGDFRVEVLETPGHTRGHVVYYIPQQAVAFVGDTLFAMGCGRLFEGSADQMWNSLCKLMHWPDETLIYCAHEYTLANGKFALSVDVGNQALQQRMEQVSLLRQQGQPTIPTTMKIEKQTNPFLRAEDADFASGLGLASRPAVEVFAKARRLKDEF